MLFVHPLVPKVREAISGEGLTARFEVICSPVEGVSQLWLVSWWGPGGRQRCGFRALPKFPVSNL